MERIVPNTREGHKTKSIPTRPLCRVLSGSGENPYYEGEGEMTLNAGDFVFHPKGHIHDFMEYSEDLSLEFALSSSAASHKRFSISF